MELETSYFQNTGQWRHTIEWLESLGLSATDHVDQYPNGLIQIVNRYGVFKADIGDAIYYENGEFYVKQLKE